MTALGARRALEICGRMVAGGDMPTRATATPTPILASAAVR